MKKSRSKASKVLWKGVFNYRHSLHVLYCYAVSERAAWRNMCYQLASKHLVDVGIVMTMFNGDNYKIEKEVKK